MGNRTGLVLEGGAMRGMFTCGVIDVLMENDIWFEGAAGISAGAVFGCNYKSRQIGRPIRYNKRFCKDPRYCSYRSLIKTGDLYGADFCYRELPDELDIFDRETFKNDPMEFYIGATDVKTGRCVYHKCTDGGETDMLWMRASASMPVASTPVEIDGNLYLDGGIADSIPYKFMESIGYDRNVIVHEVYNRQVEEIEEREIKGTAFVIRPPVPIGIGRTEKNPDELERAYQMGRKEAEQVLPHLKAFLER